VIPRISARGLGYAVGKATLIDGVDFDAAEVEFVAVVGPNGAGKTTFLRLLAGDLTPTAGTVTLAGHPPTATRPKALALLRAVLRPDSGEPIPFTVRTVVGIGRHPYRGDPKNSAARDAEVVNDALAATEITHLADRVVSTLSTGERSRVAIARVLAQDTPIVLLDEPTTALDLGHQEATMALLHGVARQGRTVVAVLHDVNAAAAYTDRVVVMDRGRIRAAGPPAEVLSDALLSEVYREPIRVVPHPFRATPMVLASRPLPEDEEES
jgi:iron complex transport system ATP-binding protein